MYLKTLIYLVYDEHWIELDIHYIWNIFENSLILWKSYRFVSVLISSLFSEAKKFLLHLDKLSICSWFLKMNEKTSVILIFM